MKTFKTLVVLMLLTAGVQAQTIKRDAEGNYIQVSKGKEEPKKTGHWYKDSKGRKYDVYMNAKGRLFVIKTSAKTGKEYRYYLPIK